MIKNDNLSKIAAGGALVSIGNVVAIGCQFLTGILVIRILSPSEYGILSLGLTLIGILVTVVGCGMGLGLPRTIAKQNASPTAKNDVGETIVSALLLATILSFFCSMFLYVGGEKISFFFSKDGLPYVLKVFSFLIPPLAFIGVLGGIFQGLESAQPSVIFSSICLNSSKTILILAIVFIGLNFNGVLAANILSAWFTLLLFSIYLIKKLNQRFCFSFSLRSTFDLLRFSFPLFGVQLLGQLITWVTMMSLGYFQSSEIVAQYSAPLRLVAFLAMPLQAVVFLYLPIVTRSITGDQKNDISDLYVSATKWVSILTLPMVLVMILDSDFIVITLFGHEYSEAATVLRILAIAHSFHSLVGPNGMTLIAFGVRKPLFYATLIGGLSSTLACVILIPIWGAVGAALGVCIGMFLSNGYISIALYKKFKIHAFKTIFFKPVFLIIVMSIILFLILKLTNQGSVLIHIVTYTALIICALYSSFVTSSNTDSEKLLFGNLQVFKKQ